jgi:NTE family protein
MEITDGPKIGVALSGGGVRGLAHLGVLQVMEKFRIPVNILAGTSMGGLVAGLYAAGIPWMN